MHSRCHLKMIHQSDLMPFPNLGGLYLHYNDISFIEDGLFDYNPNLVEIYLQKNDIFHINANAFDNLSKLNYLHLNYNTCVHEDATNPTAVKELIQEINSQLECKHPIYSDLESKLKQFKNRMKSLNSKTFKNQLAGIEAEIKNSYYAEYFTMQIEA